MDNTYYWGIAYLHTPTPVPYDNSHLLTPPTSHIPTRIHPRHTSTSQHLYRYLELNEKKKAHPSHLHTHIPAAYNNSYAPTYTHIHTPPRYLCHSSNEAMLISSNCQLFYYIHYSACTSPSLAYPTATKAPPASKHNRGPHIYQGSTQLVNLSSRSIPKINYGFPS